MTPRGHLACIKLAEVLPNPEIIIATIEKVSKAFENACPPLPAGQAGLEGYSDGVDKGEVGGDKEMIKRLEITL